LGDKPLISEVVLSQRAQDVSANQSQSIMQQPLRVGDLRTRELRATLHPPRYILK
jgi:hypothetical protein